jgi:ergothioneine biosynthesis protein EgtB
MAHARTQSDALFDCLRPDALYDRPIPERHRIVFYVGHLEAFDWNLIGRGWFQLEPFDDSFDRLFAFGIDPVDGALPNEPPSAWPALEKVHAYNTQVRATIDERLHDLDLEGTPNGSTRLEVAIEHRLMHLETLAYMFHQLPYDRKRVQSDPPAPRGRRRRASVKIPAGMATLGRSADQGFGWDNEFQAQTVEVPEFVIDSDSVTNGEYLAFMDDGGYAKRALWDAESWAWREEHGVTHPRFWAGEPGAWRWHGMFAERPLALDEPVFVSHAEAQAFARWRGDSLPTEAEFHRAAFGTPEGRERPYPWGSAAPDPSRGNFDFQRWEPAPAGAYPAGDSAFGVADLVGNGWEWTSTVFAPLPGFAAMPFYPGYSANFFDGKHYVMKGGSSRTAACMLRRSFRNWFQGLYPFVYAKFRCVER